MAVGFVRVGRGAGARPDYLLKDEHVPGFEPQRPFRLRWLLRRGTLLLLLLLLGGRGHPARADPPVEKGGRRRTLGQAAIKVAPGVEINLVVRLIQRDRLGADRAEDLERAADLVERVVRADGDAGVGDERDVRVERQVGRDPGVDPSARVAALVHPVIDEPRVPPDGDPPPGRRQVGLGGHGVLVITQVVSDVGQHLHQRDPQVGGVPLGPARHDHRQAIEDDLAEARVVLGEVVDLGLVGNRRWARGLRGAVEVGTSACGEGEVDLSVAGIEARQRFVAGPAVLLLDQPEGVGRGVAGAVDPDRQEILLVRAAAVDPGLHDPEVADAPAAVDADVGRADPLGGLVEEVDHQAAGVPFADLEGVDPVEVRVPGLAVAADVGVAPVVPAGESGVHGLGLKLPG